MNSSVYVFGNLAKGYTQYPTDSTVEIFQNEYIKSTSPAQIVVHRDGNLMYYSYILTFGDHYLGFCTVNNGTAFVDFEKMFGIYESLIERLVESGFLIGLDEKGDIRPLSTELYLSSDELNFITDYLTEDFKKLSTISLPSVDYSISRESTAHMSLADGNAAILQSTYSNSYTIVHKDEDWASEHVNSYRNVLKNLSAEKEQLATEVKELNSKLSKTEQQKKQFKWIGILGAAIVIVMIFLISSQSKLEDANDEIANKNAVINGLRSELTQKDNTISSQNSRISALESEKARIKSRLSNLASTYPIIITSLQFKNVDYDSNTINDVGSTLYSNTQYLAPVIEYNGYTNADISLRVRYYKKDNGEYRFKSMTTEYICSVSEGQQTLKLRGWGNRNGNSWPAGEYRCEIWKRNVCLYAKEFTIHIDAR